MAPPHVEPPHSLALTLQPLPLTGMAPAVENQGWGSDWFTDSPAASRKLLPDGGWERSTPEWAVQAVKRDEADESDVTDTAHHTGAVWEQRWGLRPSGLNERAPSPYRLPSSAAPAPAEHPFTVSLTHPSSQRRPLQWQSDDELALPFDSASLSAFTHPAAFDHRLSAAHLHLFVSPLSSSGSGLTSALSSLLLVRCCALVLQCIPSSLFSLSPDTSAFVVASTFGGCQLTPSVRRLLNDFAHVGSALHIIEQVVVSLCAQSADVMGVALGAALRSFCSHHKRQVESIAQRQDGARSTTRSGCTLVQLHVAAQPLAQQVLWVHRLLLSSAPSSTAPPTSFSLPTLPAGVELLSYLYVSSHSLSVASPFHATLTFLFSSALVPYLRLLATHVSCPAAHSAPHASTATAALPVPSFLQHELDSIRGAAEMVQWTDSAGGSAWTRPGARDGRGGSAVPDLSVGWSTREAERLQAELRQRAHALRSHLAAAVAKAEARVAETVQRASSRRSVLRNAERHQRLRQQVETTVAEADASSAKRAGQLEYRRQLRQQVEERKQRVDDEAARDEAESERAEERERKQSAIIEEEKAKLVAQIRAAEQGKSAGQVVREEWRRKRLTRAEDRAALWKRDASAQHEEMQQGELDGQSDERDAESEEETAERRQQLQYEHEGDAYSDAGSSADDAATEPEAEGEERGERDANVADALHGHRRQVSAAASAGVDVPHGVSDRPPVQQQPRQHVSNETSQAAHAGRTESDALVRNRQRMTASRVFDTDTVSQIAQSAVTSDTATTADLAADSPAVVARADAQHGAGQQDTTQHAADDRSEESPTSSPSPAASPTVAPVLSSPSTLSHNTRPESMPSPPAATIGSVVTSSATAHAHPLPIDIAIRATLLPSLRQQCAFIQQAALLYTLHSLRVQDHFRMLQHFLLFRAGSTMDAFTSALFHSLLHGGGGGQRHPLSSQSVQLMWSDALRTSPPPADASGVAASVVPPGSAHGVFGRVDVLDAIDSVQLRYTAPPAMSYLLHPAPLAGYGRVFTLLLRLAYAKAETRRLYEWLRLQETRVRRSEVEQGKEVRASAVSVSADATSTSARRRANTAATASDDSLLLSPTKRNKAQPPAPAVPTASLSRLSSAASRDDSHFHSSERRAVAFARHFQTSTHQRWRLRWLHAVRSEMQHTLLCLHQYAHLTVVETCTRSFMSRVAAVGSVGALVQLHDAYVSDMTAALHLNQRSPLSELVEALIATSVSLVAAVDALPPLAVRAGVGSEESAEEEERVESWQAVRDLHRQFRAHAVLLSRVLHIAVAGVDSSSGSGGVAAGASGAMQGVAQLYCAFDFNGFYARRRQHELEKRMFSTPTRL